jgi:hypothetical protein
MKVSTVGPQDIPQSVAKVREQTQLAHVVESCVLADGQPCQWARNRQVEKDVIGQQAVMSAPALESYTEIGRSAHRGAEVPRPARCR